jgi:hypothetical protein
VLIQGLLEKQGPEWEKIAPFSQIKVILKWRLLLLHGMFLPYNIGSPFTLIARDDFSMLVQLCTWVQFILALGQWCDNCRIVLGLLAALNDYYN